MAVFRVEKNNNYTCMSNFHLRDKDLSLKAIGMLSKILSLPDDWDYSFNGLVAICKENKASVRGVINELKERGYIEIIEERDDKGHYQYIYNVYEKPKTDNQTTDNQTTDNQKSDNPKTDNRPQLNTNKLNTKELNTNKLNKDKSNTKDKGKENIKRKDDMKEIIDDLVSNEDVKKSLLDFIDMRKTIKKPLTKRALEMIIKKLNTLSSNEEEQREIIDQSILYNWQGIYPIQKDKQRQQKSTGNIFRDIGIEEGIF